MITTGLMSFIANTIIGGVFKYLSIRHDGKMAIREAELKAMNAKASITKDAREYNNTGFQWTRRIIALSCVASIIVLPLWAPFFYTLIDPVAVSVLEENPLGVWFGYDVVESGFWPFSGSTTTTEWMKFDGIVVTPFHVEIMSAIMGLYFGSRLCNGRM